MSRHAIKLFAVVALAGCDAGAKPAAAAKADTWTPPGGPSLLLKPAQPRTLPNGRPACGNVNSKAPPPPECIEPARPRVLPNGRPASGNVSARGITK